VLFVDGRVSSNVRARAQASCDNSSVPRSYPLGSGTQGMTCASLCADCARRCSARPTGSAQRSQRPQISLRQVRASAPVNLTQSTHESRLVSALALWTALGCSVLSGCPRLTAASKALSAGRGHGPPLRALLQRCVQLPEQERLGCCLPCPPNRLLHRTLGRRGCHPTLHTTNSFDVSRSASRPKDQCAGATPPAASRPWWTAARSCSSCIERGHGSARAANTCSAAAQHR
jgi:hypothetical protein